MCKISFSLKNYLHLSLSPFLLSCNTLCLDCFMCSGILVTMVMKYADNIVKVCQSGKYELESCKTLTEMHLRDFI